ncbi:siderophore-interacting protein, partial [Streptomyces caniferus]
GVDDHVRLFFVDSLDIEDDAIRDFPSREFTPLAWGEDWLDFEFVSHGTQGVAGVWAGTAPIGAPLIVAGPRRSLHFEGSPDSWFLAGDESAVAQIRRYAAAIPAEATARIIVEVEDSAHEIEIDAPVPVEFVHRGSGRPGDALIAALDAFDTADRPAGSVFGFVAAEQRVVVAGRNL